MTLQCVAKYTATGGGRKNDFQEKQLVVAIKSGVIYRGLVEIQTAVCTKI